MSEKQVLGWVPHTDPSVLKRMFPAKLRKDYLRPSHLDILAQTAIVTSKRSACMFYEVGAVIIHEGTHMLSSGYNGPAKGDVNPREAGCARVIDGKLEEGKGFCRGSHAELNAINNLTVSTRGLKDLSMMITLHPCFNCAKQIVNKGIERVYYIWEYGREEFVTDYLKQRGVDVVKYESVFLDEWIKHNSYDSIGARLHGE